MLKLADISLILINPSQVMLNLKNVAIFLHQVGDYLTFLFLFQVRLFSEILMQIFEKMTQQVVKTTTITEL